MNTVFLELPRPQTKTEGTTYILENKIDIKKNINFILPGYDIHKNDRLGGIKGGEKRHQGWKNDHFNVIADNEALAIETELQNGEKVILATIYCSNRNPIRRFRMINTLSNQVIFLRGLNPKHKQFSCVKSNKSGHTLVNVSKI